MKLDEQIKDRPKCQCGETAIGFYKHLLVCGFCMEKLIAKEKEKYDLWMEEICPK